MSSQQCSAVLPVYMEYDGLDMTSGGYKKLKETEFKVWTGLRMWLPSDLDNAAINVDAG